jgi:nucleotide-binding universal stress UspA family protein
MHRLQGMPRIRHLLVPTDFSTCSGAALELACELSARLDAGLTLLHAYSLPVYPLPEGVIMASPETFGEVLARNERAIAEERQRALELGAYHVEALLTEGSPFEEIVRVARDQRVDLIVMGTHGRGTFGHLIMGSVAEKVVRKGPCPVLTVRPQPAAEGSER